MTTLTQPLEISVLAAPIAAIDPRALSQAWRSALGYADKRLRHDCAAQTHANAKANRGRRAAPATLSRRVRKDSSSQYPRSEGSRQATRVAADVAVERSGGRDPLQRAIVRVVARALQDAGARRTTLTIEPEGGRVHLMLARSGGGLRLIAVCSPHARSRVARALERARTALALQGIALGAELRAVPCT
ncbi:MAG: hypothetical protein ACREMP_02285 [Candidatus Tyrphobacter sp.]